jgi:tRNA (guanine-N7-)-methyltransferase
MSSSIRSFVIRNGRCGAKQNLAYMYGLAKYGISLSSSAWDFLSLLESSSKTIVEIGFGMGHSLIQMAQANPETLFIGIEVHRPGIGQILSEIMRLGLNNLKVAPFDAMTVFQEYIPKASLDGIQIYFPDPWPKKRHHKRRLIQTTFVHILADALKPGGYLHCATDWAPYAESMLEQIQPCSNLKNQSTTGTYVIKPDWRPQTKFEKRGIGLGHEVFDVLFYKQP